MRAARAVFEARLRDLLRWRFGNRARLVDGLGAVSAIGAGINAIYVNLRAGSTVLGELGTTASRVATSSFRITWMIPREALDSAARGLHQGFIEAAFRTT